MAITDKFLGFLQQISQCVLCVGMVTAVFAKEDVVLFIQQNKFYGGRADVDTGAVEFHGEIVSLSKGNNGFGNSAHLNRNSVKWAL